MLKNWIYGIFVITLVFTGCTKKNVYVGDNTSAEISRTLGIDSEDFRKTANEAVESMLRAGVLNKANGSKYILAISNVINDTPQNIDIDQLIKKIRIELLQTGKVIVTTAVRAGGAEDNMSYEARKLRNSDEFNQKNVAKKGKLVAPELSLGGKIIQRTSKLANGDKLVDYYFQLTLTQIETGLAIWEGETVIKKSGDSDSVTW